MRYINLLPSTIITDGIKRSCLIDIEKSIYCIVPKSLSNIFQNNSNFSYDEIYDSFDDEDKNVFEEYIMFLEANNFTISSTKKLDFIYFDENRFEIPYSIQNVIIDSISENELLERLSFFNEKPETIQLRLFFTPNFDFLVTLIDYLYQNDFLNVEIIFNHNDSITTDSYISLFYRYNIISRLIIMGYNENKTIISLKIIALKNKLINQNQCGNISENLFMANIKTVATSKSCNSCLYKKLSIDKDGNIKNCPSMPESFGNIKDTTLEEALNHPNFKKYWNINKDQIEVCKDCEFRHICTDCRAYVEEPNNQFSKPLKCGYSPYTNEWEDWSTNPLKQKAIEYYGMQELVKKDV